MGPVPSLGSGGASSGTLTRMRPRGAGVISTTAAVSIAAGSGFLVLRRLRTGFSSSLEGVTGVSVGGAVSFFGFLAMVGNSFL